jgi:hypothetical protein
VAERELSPSQKAAIYIELGMLEEDREAAHQQQGRRSDLHAAPRESSAPKNAVREAARKAGVGEHTMRDTEWLSKNAPDEYEAARAHPPHPAYEAFRGAIGDGSGERVRVFRRVAGFAPLSSPNRQDSD